MNVSTINNILGFHVGIIQTRTICLHFCRILLFRISFYLKFIWFFIWSNFSSDEMLDSSLPFSGALAVKNHLSKTIFDLIQHRKIYWIAYDMLGFVEKNERNSKNARREHVSNIITETKGSKVIRMVSKRMTYDIVL